MKTPIKTKEMNAWFNMMPGGIPSLHVTGIIDLEAEGIDACLVFDHLKKKNPPILVLKVTTKLIFSPRDPGDTEVRVHYFQPGGPGSISGIIILNNENDEIKTFEADDIDIVW